MALRICLPRADKSSGVRHGLAAIITGSLTAVHRRRNGRGSGHRRRRRHRPRFRICYRAEDQIRSWRRFDVRDREPRPPCHMVTLESGAATRQAGKFEDYTRRGRARAWSSSMPSIRSRRRRRPIWPAAGIARRASAAPVPRRSTASRAHVHDAAGARADSTSRSSSSRSGPFRCIKDLVTDVSWNYRVNKMHPAVQAAQARCARRHLADGPGRSRSRAGIPQVHRVLPVPGRLPRACAITTSTTQVRRPALLGPRRRPRDAPARHRRSPAGTQGQARHRLVQHHQVLHEGLPRAHHITDNAIIPLKERVVDEYYDPLSLLKRFFGGGKKT